MKNDSCTAQICSRLTEITSRAFPENGFSECPHVFLEGSSGSGKSQMAFSIQANMRESRQLYYFLFSPPGTGSQQIYLNFSDISGLFSKCCLADADSYDTDAGSPSCSLLFSKNLYVFGFIYELLSTGITGQDVNITRKKGSDIRELLIQKGIASERPIFILDECIDIEEKTFKKIRFVRNCFRSLGFGMVMLGTDSRAAKLIQTTGTHSRGAVPIPWCFIFGSYPAVQLDLLDHPDKSPNWIKPILQNSRPLFSRLVAEQAANGLDEFDGVMEAVFTNLVAVKPIFGDHFGRLGQLRLFHNAHFSLRDFSSQSTPLIHSHFAQLAGEENVTLMSNGFLSTEESSWRPSSVFPKVEGDVLLYLLLMGGKGYPACRFKKKMVPYAHFLMQTKSDPDFRSHILDFSNAEQSSNDGMFLESLLCATVCLASHCKGFSGVDFKSFLSNLVYQLQADNINPEDISIDDSELLYNQIPLNRIPFLSPPNQEWPSFLEIPNSNFGNLERTRNADRIDLWAPCGIAGESKDYGSAIDLAAMRAILSRIPAVAKLELIFIRKLQESYFNAPALEFKKEYAGGAGEHLLKRAYFMIDASQPKTKVEIIKGLPWQDYSNGVVLFVEVNTLIKG